VKPVPQSNRNSMRSSVLRTAAGTLLFGGVHSLLASRQAKEGATRLAGRRQRSGLYRGFFILQSFLTLGLLWNFTRPLPDRVIYHVRGFPAALMRLVQALGLAHAVYAAGQVGLLEISGMRSGLEWLQGRPDVQPEPEAQGPRLDSSGNLKATGPFRWSRHPLNFSPLLVFWFNPLMTVKFLVFNLVSTVYLILGSLHEESRLRAAYGQPYTRYQHSRVPFYLPAPAETRQGEMHE